MINQMCSWLNETPLGLQLSRALGPTALPQLELSSQVEAASSATQKGLGTGGRALVACPRLSPAHPACPNPTVLHVGATPPAPMAP